MQPTAGAPSPAEQLDAASPPAVALPREGHPAPRLAVPKARKGGGAATANEPPGAPAAPPAAADTPAMAAAAPKSRSAAAATRAAGLDGVRALAVLAVLGFHENLPWLPGGFLGVDVFFVLSGYLITDLLVTRINKDGMAGLRNFWLRRARRLLPALALMLVVVTAAVAVFEPAQLAALRSSLIGAVSYTSNWAQALQHQSYFANFGPPAPLEHLWSLAVEEQFYLIWPLVVSGILLTVDKVRWRPLVPAAGALASAIAMAVSYQPGHDPSRVYFGTDTHAAGLMLGATLALALPLARATSAARPLCRRLDLLGLACLGMLCLACWHFTGADPVVYRGGLALATLAAGGLVLAATVPGVLSRALSRQPLRWLGVRSYGIYLWHWPVIAITAALVPASANTLAARVTDAALAITIAALSWRWLEEPVQRLGMLAVLRSAARRAGLAISLARQSPAAALPLALPAALLMVACTAGYGIVAPPAGRTLQQQIAAGERISSTSQAGQPRLAASDVVPAVAIHPHFATSGPGPAVRRPHAGHPALPGRKVTAIGDSVMLAAAPELHAALPGIYINAKVSRQMSSGVKLVHELAAAGKLRPVVIVGLGTNGVVTSAEIHQLRTALGRRLLVLVNTYVPRPWEREVNLTMWSAARRFHDVRLIDWRTAIEHRTWLLWSDGVHPQPSGGRLYARLVRYVVQAALRHR